LSNPFVPNTRLDTNVLAGRRSGDREIQWRHRVIGIREDGHDNLALSFAKIQSGGKWLICRL